MEISITEVPEQNRYEAHDPAGHRLGLVEYIRTSQVITFTHTEVDPAAEGQGVASKLARHVLDRARADGLQVKPLCPFIAEWIDRHPDYSDLVRPRSSTATERE